MTKTKKIIIKEREKSPYDPEFNHEAISIIRQPDGNWIGKMFKNGKLIEWRDSDPQLVLLKLLTHDGS